MFAQTSIVNCGTGTFTAQTGGPIGTGPTTYCGVATVGNQPSNWALAGNTYTTPISSGVVNLIPNTGGGGTHNVVSMTYQTTVNVQAFTASFEFNPNGQCIVFMLTNNNNPNVDGGASHMIGGASGECGIYQGFGTTTGTGPSPNNTFAIVFHGDGKLTQGASYTYSTVQMYGAMQAPFLDAGAENIAAYPTNQLSTSPVNMNNPNTVLAGSTDTFQSLIGYDGSTVSMCLVDVTAANGTCTSSTSGTGTYFTTSWSNVSIPSIVGGTTAYMGYTDSTGACCSLPLNLLSASYTVNTPTANVGGFVAYNASSTTNNGTVSTNSPVFSEAGGSYGSAQSIAMTVASSPNNYICYLKLAAGTTPTVLPYPDGIGGCASGTLYTSAVSVTTSSDLYAVSGSNTLAFGATLSPTGLGPASPVTKATYTIGSGTAATPTFSPAAGSYGPAQSVTISDSTSGASIYYCTSSPCTSGGTLVTGTISVSSTETLYAYATASGYTQSSTGSAAYTINGAASTPTFSPGAGTYTGSHTVTASTGTSACSSYLYFDTNATPTTNQSSLNVVTSETVYAYVHGCPGYSDSSIASAAYIINAAAIVAGQGGNLSTNVPIQ